MTQAVTTADLDLLSFVQGSLRRIVEGIDIDSGRQRRHLESFRHDRSVVRARRQGDRL